VKRIDLPAPIFFAWLVLTVVLMVQGMRLAQDRQETLEPFRPLVLGEGAAVEFRAQEGWILHEAGRRGRLAVYQVLPERRLLRWVEDEAAGSPLLIPTAGFGPGEYVITDAPARSGAASQEMDRPAETLPVRARFTVLPD
jgi:hypothetical protein